jgi:PAS domain S-box-containing protein
MECSSTNNLVEIAKVGEKLSRLMDFNNKLITAINTSIEGIALLDENGVYVWMNDAHETIFGYGRDELIGKSWTDLYSKEDVDYFVENVFPIIEMNGYWKGEATAICKDGKTKIEEVLTLTALPDGGLICTCRDKNK